MLIALGLYGASTAFFMLFLSGISTRSRVVAMRLLLAAAAMHLLAIGHHHASGHEPSILSVPALINVGVFVLVAGVLLAGLWGRGRWFASILAPLATVVLGTVVNNFGRTTPHMEMVRFITPVHIVTSAIGFLFFGLAFVAAAAMIAADYRIRTRRTHAWPKLPPVDTLNHWASTCVNIGFPFYTLGIVLGAVWAYWADGGLIPEYALGVATWALYAVLVYLFHKTGWRGRRAAALIMLGFIATIPIVIVYGLRRWMGS